MKFKINRLTVCLSAALPLFLSTFVAAEPSAETKSGIYGTSAQQGFSAMDQQYSARDYDLIIKDAKSKKTVKKVRTKSYGDFNIALTPGKYIVIPMPGNNSTSAPPSLRVGTKEEYFSKRANVTVWKGYRTAVFVFFEH